MLTQRCLDGLTAYNWLSILLHKDNQSRRRYSDNIAASTYSQPWPGPTLRDRIPMPLVRIHRTPRMRDDDS